MGGESPGGEKEEAPSKSQAALINGSDNRLEVGAHPDFSLRLLARFSTAAVMTADKLNVPPTGAVTYNAPTLQQAHNLCNGEHFLSEQTPVSCTATLIDNDLVLTDGHCVTAATCANTRFSFGYYRFTESSTPVGQTADDIFSCQSVVTSQTTPADFAIVRLNRVATPRHWVAPVRVNRAPLTQGAAVAAIGFPDGAPAKITSGGNVLSEDATPVSTFRLTNDGTAAGSLGAGVYYADTEELAGVFSDPSHGQADYVPGPAGSTPTGCNVSQVCQEQSCGSSSGSFPTATYVGPALDAYCASNTNPRLCQPRGSFAYSGTSGGGVLRQAVFLEPGATIDLGTCVTPGSSAVGDTTIELLSPDQFSVASNDDGGGSCGVASHLTYTVPPLTGGRYVVSAACYGSTSCSGTVAYTISGPTVGSFSYSGTNTNSAQQSTRDVSIALRQGETLVAGTCGLEDAAFSGDTVLRLLSGTTQIGFSDDACGGLGSQLSYTAPSAQTVTLRAGCYGSSSCDAALTYTKGITSVSYSAINTNNGLQNTVNQTVHLVPGDKLTVGTCGLPGASYTGDTFVSLYSGSTQLTFNDDSCHFTGSRLAFRATTAGDYGVHLGCNANTACGGNAVIRVTPPDSGSGTELYSLSNSNSALQIWTGQMLFLRAGDIISFGTCPSLAGANGTGDSFVRLFGPNGIEAASNDDNCSVGSSLLSWFPNWTIDADSAGTYELRTGCYGNTTCSGTVAFNTP